ncbi:MAG: bifunctional metallophosphatase/5'-nucleotidase [Paludibacteraceae bacterium]
MKHWLLVGALALGLCACVEQASELAILHTNDTHSQVEAKGNGTGGYAARMAVIESVLEKEHLTSEDVLLLDAGDFCQGTPYFNFFRGRVEVDALNRMGYDAVTLGNHEFDNGIDTLAAVLREAQFAVVCANYGVEGTALEGIVKPYTIVKKGGRKIGIFGLGVYPNNLIAAKNFAGITYHAPYPVAQQTADELRAKGCDLVVCLSHMGTYPDKPEDCCDTELAAQTRNIDIIIGGHTHKVYDNLRIRNLDGKEIPVCQMGKSGTQIGKIVVHFEGKQLQNTENLD